jgi:hypothetical protein
VRSSSQVRSPTRRILLILLAIAAVGVAIGVIARNAAEPGEARRGQAAERAPDRAVGPSGGTLAPRRGRLPSAADILRSLAARVSPGGLVVIEGRVLDAISRATVGGVEVVFVGAQGETTALADADGAYRVDLPRGDYRAFVRGDHVISVGQAPFERLPGAPDPLFASLPDDQLAPMIRVADPQTGVDLEVQRSGTVIGRVVDARGRPVSAAVVRAEVGLWRPVLGTHLAETAADGTFRLEVPGGYYDLVAAHPDFAGAALKAGQRPSVMVYPATETAVELALTRGCVITGRAVRRDGSPVGAGAIERSAHGSDFFPAGQLQEDGTFRYTTVLDEEVTVRVWPWKAAPAAPRTFHCRDGGRHVAEFVIPDAAADLSGRIVDADGDPAPGAYLDIYGLGHGTMNQQERADDHGHWGVFALPPGTYAITAYVPGRGIATAQVTAPGRDVELRLSGTGSLSGEVDGVADGATFQLEIAGCIAPHGRVMMPATTRMVPVVAGRYRVDDVPACRLVAHARTAARATAFEVTVPRGASASHHLDLAPPRHKTVRITVVDPGGAAVADAQVLLSRASPGGGAPDAVLTDAHGQVTVQAFVGDFLHVFAAADPRSSNRAPLVGEAVVSDAAGTVDELVIRLAPSPAYGP